MIEQNLWYRMAPEWAFRREDFGGLVYKIPTGAMFSVNSSGFELLRFVACQTPTYLEILNFLRQQCGMGVHDDPSQIQAFLDWLALTKVIDLCAENCRISPIFPALRGSLMEHLPPAYDTR